MFIIALQARKSTVLIVEGKQALDEVKEFLFTNQTIEYASKKTTH
jgi:5S rRNA maturation endonuclease (ribonuclease M5)